MTMRLIGAGLGRTGTMSLKVALERLLGAPCYHMTEVFAQPEFIPAWHNAAQGVMPDWNALFQNYAATVDWPAAAFWPELVAAFPDAVILHSVRDEESWWQSASQTIFPAFAMMAGTPWHAMFQEVVTARFATDLTDRAACLTAFRAHNARVQAEAPTNRLLTWRASDGWPPLCKALGVPIPDEPFPRANTRDEFLNLHG